MKNLHFSMGNGVKLTESYELRLVTLKDVNSTLLYINCYVSFTVYFLFSFLTGSTFFLMSPTQ